MKKILHHPFFIRLLNWEYWPFGLVYLPIYFYWLGLCVKARSFFFFNTANPTIENGGFLMESKHKIYNIIPPQFYPPTLFFKAGTPAASVVEITRNAGLQFPLIGKPDIGMRGLSVQKLENETDLTNYVLFSGVDFLVQNFIPFDNEIGIFYYRYPNQAKGHISGIVGKEFLAVTGDGKSTIETLLRQDARFVLQLPTLQHTHAAILQTVLQANETYLLVPYGNHCRGTKFVDISHLIDAELTETMDAVCQQIPGFYFGRMDIRYNNWEDLRHGKNFGIVELNGAGSEPTHIYDPKHSLLFAWKEIIKHLNILFAISRINQQLLQLPYMNFYSGMQLLRANAAYVKLISKNYIKAE